MLFKHCFIFAAHAHSAKPKRRSRLIRKLSKLFMQPALKRTEKQTLQTCGQNWQEKYIKLHEKIIQSSSSPNYLVYDCDGLSYGCGGYGNRIGAISSLLLLAVLTNRAFLINWKSNVTILDYMQPKNIDWDFSKVNIKGLSRRHHMWGKGDHKNLPVDTLRFQGKLNNDFLRWFQKTNLTKFFNSQVEMVTSQWYFVSSIRKNKFFGEDAKKIFPKPKGHRYSFIGCAYNFLFKRTQRFENLLQKARGKLHWKSLSLRIGIHFRAGDFSFKKAHSKSGVFDLLEKFFDCAKRLELRLKELSPSLKTSTLKWFLATDNMEVKHYAHNKYSNKVISLGVTVEHINSKEPSRAGLEGVLLDNVLLSECDVLILSESTFSHAALGIGFHSSLVSSLGDQCIY